MQNSKPLVVTPTLKRRFVCLVYDTLLHSAVVMLPMLIFLLLTQRLPEWVQLYGRIVVFFATSGAYFIHSWIGSGYTLAMKTWRIKVVKVGHAQVPLKSAILRYVFAWGWVFPSIVVCYVFGLTANKGVVVTLVTGNVVLWGLSALLDKDGQFLHDRLAGTRLIQLPKPVKAQKAKAPVS